MTDQDDSPDIAEDAAEEQAAEADAGASRTVNKGGLAILAIIVISLTWYLLADRYTPSTDQARVQGYVVGVAPQVAGIVTQVWVKNNQSVQEGEPLFEIDKSQYEIALAKAQSDLANAVRQVDAGSAAVEAARANLRAALAGQDKAEKDTRRLERLVKQDPGTISTRRLEVSRASLEQARARVAASEADIRRAIEQKGGDDDDENKNTILQIALTAVDQANLDLSRTVVRASSRGVITDLRADVGQFAGAGSPVLTLVAIHDVWVRAEFTENNLGHIRPGTRAEILFDALPGRVFDGELSSIGLGISAQQAPPPGTLPTIQNDRDWLRQAQRFPVIVRFDAEQDEALYEQLRIGGQATVIAYSEGHGVLGFLGKAYIRLMGLFAYAY